MAVLGPKGDLSAIEIAFYAPALLVSAFNVLRHGFSRQQGWIYLVILAILRIIGASCILYLETQHTFNTDTYETAVITSSIGVAPLMLALVGFLQRVNADRTTSNHGVSSAFFRIFQLLALVALILAIVGGTDEARGSSTSASFRTGRSLREAGAIMFLCLYICCGGLATWFIIHLSAVAASERKLIFAALFALPFLLVRVLYSILVAFEAGNSSSVFWYQDINVYVQAFMQFLMEAIVVIAFIAVGLLTPKNTDPARSQDVYGAAEVAQPHDMQSRSTNLEPGSGGTHEKTSRSKRNEQPQQRRGLLDYLPHRLLLNAVHRRQAGRSHEGASIVDTATRHRCSDNDIEAQCAGRFSV